jgi:hypothetical protein
MPREVALVFDKDGKTIAFHGGQSAGSIEDSPDLWTILWENRKRLGGVAHTHPWDGDAWFSQTDVTTFRAIDNALGKNLLWPVVTFTNVTFFQWHRMFGDPLNYRGYKVPPIELEDIEKLREMSR